MFDYLRVAAFVTLIAGGAGASGQILPANVPVAPPVVAAVPQNEARLSRAIVESLPETYPTEQAAAEPSIGETAQGETLAALVRRHAASDTLSAEQECLAVATYFEAKGEPLGGQLAVAKVILNRAASGRFARTACGVVRQAGQFSFVHGGAFPAIARTSSNWRTAVAVAHIALNDLYAAPAANALYFHAKRVSPNWRMIRVASVGNHVFYR